MENRTFPGGTVLTRYEAGYAVTIRQRLVVHAAAGVTQARLAPASQRT
jgi:hypothetical protein